MATWNAYTCDEDYVSMYVYTNGGTAAIKLLVLTRDDGVKQTLMRCCENSTDAQASVIPARSYGVKFNGGTPTGAHRVPGRLRVLLRHGQEGRAHKARRQRRLEKRSASGRRPIAYSTVNEVCIPSW